MAAPTAASSAASTPAWVTTVAPLRGACKESCSCSRRTVEVGQQSCKNAEIQEPTLLRGLGSSTPTQVALNTDNQELATRGGADEC
eukprot:scaffold172867_cov19-Tisochrysis_lutea.AAC.1